MRKWLMLVCLGLFAGLAVAAGNPDFLVDADWLAEKLKDPRLVVLEVRCHPHRHTTVGHIPGAVQVQRFADLGANDEMPIMRFPSRAAFQATLRRGGVNDDSTIVVHDDSSTACEPKITLLDARPADMYDGSRIQHSVQGGHIPGAINIVSLQGVDGQSQQWKSMSELAAMCASTTAAGATGIAR